MNTTYTETIAGRFSSGRLHFGRTQTFPSWLVFSDDAEVLDGLRKALGSEDGPNDDEIGTISPLVHIWINSLEVTDSKVRVTFTLVHARELGLFEFQSAANAVIDAWTEAGLAEKLEETGTPVRATLDVKPRASKTGTSVLPTLIIREDLT